MYQQKRLRYTIMCLIMFYILNDSTMFTRLVNNLLIENVHVHGELNG